MAQKPKIQRKPQSQPPAPADLDAFLNANATSQEVGAQPTPKPDNGAKRGRPKGSVPKGNFRQSVPVPVLDRLDTHLTDMENPPSRNAWIVQAIIEKLDRDKNDT